MDLFDAREREERARAAPLAERMRPRQLDEVLGLEAVLAPGAPLRALFDASRLVSLIFYGPPGSGKTTLARLLAQRRGYALERLSAVTSGVKDVRAVVERARERAKFESTRTVVFLDEIHRFNKAQQDALLPHVEDGTLVLFGATTENPLFEINNALRSRCRLVVLPRLEKAAILALLRRALEREDRGLGGRGVIAEDEALDAIAGLAGGDARAALNLLEACALAAQGPITPDLALAIAGGPQRSYDKTGEDHYNALSALHKSLRGSDPDGALYWVARMLDGGEDPKSIARRLVRFASEDIGLADPGALGRAVAAQQASVFLGRPEGDLALIQAAVDLALAPKSNALELAYDRARADIAAHGSAPVPLHLRNIKVEEAPDGARYLYPHAYRHAVVPQEHLPAAVLERSQERPYYRPSSRGREERLSARLRQLERLKEEGREAGLGAWKLPEDDPEGWRSEAGLSED